MIQSNGSMNKRGIVSIIIFFLVVGVVSLFLWRTLSFYKKIQDGTLKPADLSFSSHLTTSNFAKAVATQTTGTVDVVSVDDPTLGSKDATLTIVEFADFGCPYSKEVSDVVRRLAVLYGSNVRFIYRDFPLVDLHPDAEIAAEAGACANDQHQFWSYHDKLFQHQDDLSVGALRTYAEQVGLNMNEYDECMRSQLFGKEVANDLADGLQAGVIGTPTFFFNGTKIEGAIPEDIFDSVIQAFLTPKTSS